MPRKKKASPKKQKSKTKYNIQRPPVVTMLGHVDHGKTSLLDAIRGTDVQGCEAGGITQSVRAHQVTYKEGKESYKITFVDTPGHKAFSEMRSRGANVTDIVVLVVAADDGVQPQTKEAIEFAKEADVPIIVALNKVDIGGVEKAKVLRDLSTAGVQVEKLGGDVIYVETSAKKKTGIDELLKSILLVAELNELKVEDPGNALAKAIVLESTIDKSLGVISLCLVKAGEINIGDYVIFNDINSRIRAIKDENFCDKKKGEISDPIWLLGFNNSIPVGETLEFYEDIKDKRNLEAKEELDDEKKAKPKAESKEDDEEDAEVDKEILSQLLQKSDDEEAEIELPVILKSDAEGTLEVVEKEVKKASGDNVSVKILDASTGDITGEDIMKAKDARGIVIGFKTNISKKTSRIAQSEKVLVRNYKIIYKLLDEIDELIESLQEPEEVEVEVARAQIKKVFELSDGSKVAGCKVTKGTILKGYTCYVEREGEKMGEAKIISLKHNKDEVREASLNTECGIQIEPEVEFEKGDEIVCFKIEKH